MKAVEKERITATTAEFALHVVATQSQSPPAYYRYRLALWQRALVTRASNQPKNQHLVTIGNTPLLVAMEHVFDALKLAGYRATALHPQRQDPFILHEEIGVRLALLFLAIKPLTKVARMEVLATHIRLLSVEETYYWFSKCTLHKQKQTALRAFRILLAPE
jgi:hypothetical protein